MRSTGANEAKNCAEALNRDLAMNGNDRDRRAARSAACGVAAALVAASEDRPHAMLDATPPEASSSSCAEDAAHTRTGQRSRHRCALPSLHPICTRCMRGPGCACEQRTEES